MRLIIIICFLLSCFRAASQIQFWTKDEIIDRQFQSARNEMNLHRAFNYTTFENWAVEDSTRYNEIIEYDKNGRKIGYKKYKTDWVKNKRYFMYIDSIFYNDKTVFSELKGYSPQNDGSYYALEYDAKAILNAKGQIQKINYYRGNGATELDSYDLYSYDAKNRVIKIINYTKDGEKDNEWKIDYDNNNRVIKVRSTSAFGFTDYIMKYNANGLLTLYTALYNGKEKESEVKYSYDTDKRLTEINNKTSSAYADTTQYWYRNSEKAFYRSYLKYPRASGSDTDFAHEYLVFKFEKYD